MNESNESFRSRAEFFKIKNEWIVLPMKETPLSLGWNIQLYVPVPPSSQQNSESMGKERKDLRTQRSVLYLPRIEGQRKKETWKLCCLAWVLFVVLDRSTTLEWIFNGSQQTTCHDGRSNLSVWKVWMRWIYPISFIGYLKMIALVYTTHIRWSSITFSCLMCSGSPVLLIKRNKEKS